MMKKLILLVIVALTITGCGNNAETEKLKKENTELKMQVTQLETQNTDFKNRLTKYEVLPPKNTQQNQDQEQPPVELQKMIFNKDGVTSVSISFVNRSPKTVDAIEFVILQFDNFGRPSYRFRDSSYGNVSGELLMQGKANQGETMRAGWTLYNADNTTKGKIVIKKVHFIDGVAWENLKFQEQTDKEKESNE